MNESYYFFSNGNFTNDGELTAKTVAVTFFIALAIWGIFLIKFLNAVMKILKEIYKKYKNRRENNSTDNSN